MPNNSPEQAKAYYLANKEHILEKARQYYQKNKEAIKNRTRQYYQDNREDIREKGSQYYQNNKEGVNQRNRRWVKNNPDKAKKIKATYRRVHRGQLQVAGRLYMKENRKQVNAYRRTRRSDRAVSKHEKLQDKYLLSFETFTKIIVTQKGSCGICLSPLCDPLKSSGNLPLYPCVDHDHITGEVRGVLCRYCNSGIGSFRDDPVLLERALSWLKRGRTPAEIEISVIPKRSIKRCVTKYGIVKGQYKTLLDEHDGFCGICFESMKKVNIDHDHSTGKIRGLLCRRCNMGIGLLMDNSENIERAIKWVQKKGYTNENG